MDSATLEDQGEGEQTWAHSGAGRLPVALGAALADRPGRAGPRRQVRLFRDPAPFGAALAPASDRPGAAPAPAPHWPGTTMPALLAQLLAAPGPAQRQRVVDAAVRALDFNALGYTRLRWAEGRPQAMAACTAHSDGVWARHYFAEGYEQIDPRLHAVADTALPCIWDVDRLRDGAPPHLPRRRLERFVDDLRASGARSGLMVALAGPLPHEYSCISLRSPQPAAGRFTDTLIGRALALAYCVHEVYGHHATPPQPTAAAAPPAPAGELLPIQTVILRSLAQGLSDKQIADRLNLNGHTVDYHMRRLRRLFGVRNRVQLLDAARHWK